MKLALRNLVTATFLVVAPLLAAGCSSGPKDFGTDHQRSDALLVGGGGGAPTCPGAGWYCGGDQMDGDPSTLYSCSSAGAAPDSSQFCSSGCSVEAAGTPDVCASGGPACPGSGAYCGSDGVTGGDPNTLYQCTGAGAAPTSSSSCANGCSIQPAGMPDVCAGGGGNGASCSAAGQSALGWEAGELAGGNSYSDECLAFVNQAYQAAGLTLGYLQQQTAAEAMASAQSSANYTGWGGACPCGAILFWDANSCNGWDGHVAICNGDGTVSTSGWPGFGGNTSADIGWMTQEECNNAPDGYVVP
jgi:hypothetical protein